MRSFIKIVLLVSFIVGAIVSIFIFSGTRIMEGVDVSHIEIQKSVYTDDIQQRIDGIGEDWLDGFNRVDNLISVYYGNSLLSSDDEKIVKTSLVDRAAYRLTTYALNDYFMHSAWNDNDIKHLQENSIKLLNYKSASGDKVAQRVTKFKLDTVKQSCQNYFDAVRLSLKYRNNRDAEREIDLSKKLRGDLYLMHDTLINRKLKNAVISIRDSHLKMIADSINAFDDYSRDNIGNTSNFAIARNNVSSIEAIVNNYEKADFYHPKEIEKLNAMIVDLNYIIDDWNKEIKLEEEETYREADYPYNIKTRIVRKYPEERIIEKLEQK